MADVYDALTTSLRKYGEVLSEHVADRNLSASGETHLTNKEIFARDLAWIHAADAIVAEVTNPSLGVGYEIALAETLGKPILCLFDGKSERRLSAMLAGNPAVTISTYRSLEEAQAAIRSFIATIDGSYTEGSSAVKSFMATAE